MVGLRKVFPQTVYARRIVRNVLPDAAAALERWQKRIRTIPNAELRRQAWASITAKRFHAEGGSVYGALEPGWSATLVPLIVALQTISDYLDNLCDRSGSMDEDDFRRLHRAMLDAVDGRPPALDATSPRAAETAKGKEFSCPYYALHPNKDDGLYLQALVDECRSHIAKLPSYDVVKPHVTRLVGLYNDLQVYKHGPVHRREQRLRRWFDRAGSPWSDLHWWEFAAASGSTLGVFALFTAATRPNLTEAEAKGIVRSYFPWICGWHILLDYLIDQDEDVREGDLNFVRYYPDVVTMRQRLTLFAREARRHAALLPDSAFHTTIVQGLAGLYLSDEKVGMQRMQPVARALLRAVGPASFVYYVWCRLRRRFDPSAKPPPAPVAYDEN